MKKKSAAGKSAAEETIVNKELFEALAALEKERGISQDYMLERVEAALLSAFRKEYKGKNRFSMTEGCEERISLQFFWWLIWTGRTKKRREKFKALQQTYPNKITVIKNQRQLDEFRSNVKKDL